MCKRHARRVLTNSTVESTAPISGITTIRYDLGKYPRMRLDGPGKHVASFAVDYTERSITFGWNVKLECWRGTNIRTVLKHLEVVSGQCILANTCPYNGATLRIPNVAEGPANLPRTNRVRQQRTLREG